MIYRIGKKYYILVQGYYKEVDVKVEGDNLALTPNGNEIEVNNASNVEKMDLHADKDKILKSLKREEPKEETKEASIKKYRRYDKRM